MAGQSRVYAIMNRKGGVGKTTTSVTLAYGLSRKLLADDPQDDGHVIVVDLDPQGNVAPSLGVRPNEKTLAAVLLGNASLKEVVVSAGPERRNLFVLPSDDTLADARVDLMAAEFAAGMKSASARSSHVPLDQILVERLGSLRKVFDYIILDCPPSLDVLVNAVFNFADSAIVPVKPDYLGATGTVQHTRNIIEAQKHGIDIKIDWFVPTFYRRIELLANQMLEDLIDTYGKTRVAEPIPQAAAVEQAPASGGLTILEYDPASPAAKAYQRLVEGVYG